MTREDEVVCRQALLQARAAIDEALQLVGMMKCANEHCDAIFEPKNGRHTHYCSETCRNRQSSRDAKRKRGR